MNDYKPVPKVLAQFVTGLVVAIVLALLAKFGVAGEPANDIAALVASLVMALLPVLAGFVAGWLKTDPDRELLKQLLAAKEAVKQMDQIFGDEP